MEKYCNICCSLYFGLYTIILTICALFPRLYLSIKMHYKLFVVFIDHICPSYMEVARKYNIFQTIIVFQDAIKSGASSNPLKFQLSQCYARCNLVQLIKFANEKLIQFPSFVKGTNCEWVFRSCKKSCYLLTQNNLNWKHKYVAALDFYII